MNKPVYILSACAISPQHSFLPEQLLTPVVSSDSNKLYVVDQDYTKYISPVAIRRMSRLLKMSISAGMQCVRNAGDIPLDGIITGTARGSVTDMEHFLKDMIKLNEEALNPTYFIQSTYNSVNGWLALQTKCTGYNQTFVHRGLSFELTLFDAQSMLEEANEPQCYLAGGFDELTEEFYFIKNKKDYWKKEEINSLSLFQHTDTPGTISGEGAAFFTISNQEENALCTLRGVDMLHGATPAIFNACIGKLLQRHGLTFGDVDVVVAGMNGDVRTMPLYEELLQQAGDNVSIAVFKHLCGEYDTASGFALWLATQIMATQAVPEMTLYKKGNAKAIRNILICNHNLHNDASAILISATGSASSNLITESDALSLEGEAV